MSSRVDFLVNEVRGLVREGYEDSLIKDPFLQPKNLKKFFVSSFKKIGRGTKVEVVKCETTMPHGWTHGNYTVLKITLPKGKGELNVALNLNAADDEVSGYAKPDSTWGATITVPRKRTAEAFVTSLVNETIDHLKAAMGDS